MRRLAATIEQLDLALEHLSKGDANNARFALMLLDNLTEITLHNFAQYKRREHESRYRYRDKDAPLDPALAAALNRNFDPKVKFAHSAGIVSEDGQHSVTILHLFRNEVYHIGLQYEPILHALAHFYFGLTCDLHLNCVPRGYSYGPKMTIPERAMPYFSTDGGHYSRGLEQYKAALALLRAKAAANAPALAPVLADHLDDLIEGYNKNIDLIATGGPHPTSRDDAVVDSQVWPFAFSDEGKRYAQEKNCPPMSVLDHVMWIKANYRWPVSGDPIAGWRRRADGVRHDKDPHKALKKFRDFMDQTEVIRELLSDAAMQVDEYIEMEIQRRRGN